MISYTLESGKNEDVQLHHDLTHFTCFADACSGIVGSAPERAESTVTYVTTTTTAVGERKGTAVRTTGESTMSSRTSSGVQSSFLGWVRRKAHVSATTEAGQSPNFHSDHPASNAESMGASKPVHNSLVDQLLHIQRLHREEKDCILDFVRVDYDDYKRSYEEQFEVFRAENERLTRELSHWTAQITEAGQPPNIHSASKAPESRRSTVPSNPVHNSALDQLLHIQRLHREEKERMLDFVRVDYDDYKRSYEEQFESFRTENERLTRELSASTSQIILLKIHLSSLGDGTASQHDIVDSTITTKITTVTTRIEQWKHVVSRNKGQITISNKELDQLLLDLSTASSQTTELQEDYAGLSRDFSSVRCELTAARNELQARISSSEDKDRTVAALTAQVEEWKRSDALKEECIVAIRKQAEDLQRELTSTSSDITELLQCYEVQSREFVSHQDQLQDKVSGKDRHLTSHLSQTEERKRSDVTKGDELTTIRKDLAQLHRYLAFQLEGWKSSDATKTEELTVAQKEVEQLRRDLSTSSSQIIEYQQRYAAQLAELTSQTKQWKRSDAAKAEELATAGQKIEQLQHDLSTSSSRITQLQQRYEAKSAELSSVREQLQATLPLGGGKDRTAATLNAQIEQWKRGDAAKAEELEQLQRKLSASSSELDTLRKSTSMSEETRKVYEKITTEEVKDYAAVIKHTTVVDEWLRADAKKAEELRHSLVTLKEIYIRAPALKQNFQSETTGIEIQKYEKQSRELKSDLAERRSPLDDVQRFVIAADNYADTMIIQMLQKLNAEVQQNAEFMAEWMLKDFGPRAMKLTKEQSSAVQRVSESIGKTLTGYLGSGERNDAALYLSIAFQAYLTYYLHSVISSWTIKKDRDEFINEIYERLQKSGKKLIFGCHQLFCSQ